VNQRIALQVDEAFYIKDPMSSDLGESIVEHGILMLDDMGYETFTFRKLAERIGTTEASIYRYFKSKHRLLLYLTAWYWSWMEYRLQLATANVVSAEERLRLALRELTQRIQQDYSTPRIDEEALYRLVLELDGVPGADRDGERGVARGTAAARAARTHAVDPQ
jgi:AcrR family transcriptional regulator